MTYYFIALEFRMWSLVQSSKIQSSFALPFRDGIHIHVGVIQVQVRLCQIHKHSQSQVLNNQHRALAQIQGRACAKTSANLFLLTRTLGLTAELELEYF